MNWFILIYESGRGDKPVEVFIKSLETPTIAKIAHHIELLKLYGSRLTFPHAKKLNIQLYELRIRGKQEIRIIYAFKGSTIYLLHAFKKQKQKLPQKEIGIAQNRWDSLTRI